SNEVSPQLVGAPLEVHQPGQDDIENTAGFAGADHVDVEPRKVFGMAGERFGQGLASLDLLKNILDDGAECRLGGELGGNSQAPVQGETGADQSREFFGEEEDILASDPLQADPRQDGLSRP